MFYKLILTLESNGVQAASSQLAKAAEWSRADIIAVFAACIAVVAVFITIYSSFLNKKLEIKFIKFDKLVLSSLNELFQPIEKHFSDHSHVAVSFHLQELTESLVDIELFLVHLEGYYTTLELVKLTKIKEKFSDHLYQNATSQIKEVRIEYLAFKTRIFFELYDFARKNYIGYSNRIYSKIKKRTSFFIDWD